MRGKRMRKMGKRKDNREGAQRCRRPQPKKINAKARSTRSYAKNSMQIRDAPKNLSKKTRNYGISMKGAKTDAKGGGKFWGEIFYASRLSSRPSWLPR